MRKRDWTSSMAMLTFAATLGLTEACGSDGPKTDAEHQSTVTTEMKAYLSSQLDAWLTAAKALQVAAPLPAGRGWDLTADAPAIAATKMAWNQARLAYEKIEGAIAPLFPDSDTATDARYDDYLADLGPTGDPYLFDEQGVIGMHGIERILFSDQVPATVVDFEKDLPGYQPAAFPRTEKEAADFKNKLAVRLVTDIMALQGDFRPLNLDLGFAFDGVIDLVNEQVEKVLKTASGEEESRYSQLTLRDLRANYDGCFAVYGIFQPWLRSKMGGIELDAQVLGAFARLKSAYEAIPGDAMPQPPATWNSTTPTATDLATPFGRLFSAVQRESDKTVAGSLHAELARAVKLMGLSEQM